jgi:tRNA A-37 threonylcarbamoyl transferase component Bud32
MGTSGWFALLHKGRYYRVHQHYDCYFSGLGAELEKELKSMDLETLLNLWRTLLDLAVIQDAMLAPPTEESVLSEWNKCMKSLPSGPVSQWLSDVKDEYDSVEARHLTMEHDPYLSRGDGCFIEYIYLIDMDNNEFSGLEANHGRKILRFPLDTALLPIFGANWVENMEKRRAWKFAEAFPLPGSVEDPLMESIAQHGYEVTKRISYSRTAAVYRARCTRVGAPSDVVLKVFFKIGNDSTYMRPMAIADLLLSMPHPHVVKIISKESFANCPSLVLEAYEGDLADLNVSSPEGKEVYVKALVQAAAGLVFLHTKGIVHHDFKPKNILYRRDSNGGIEAAICDFESVCIPYIFDARWLELSWGPYEHAKTRLEARIVEDDVSDDSIDFDVITHLTRAQESRHRDRRSRRHDKAYRAQEDPRWEDSWDPIRWTRKYLHDNSERVLPWALDSFSLATMLEDLDKDNKDSVLHATAALLKNSDTRISVDEAVSRLGQVGDLLEKRYSGLK